MKLSNFRWYFLAAVMASMVLGNAYARNGWTRSCFLEIIPNKSYGGMSNLNRLVMTCSQRQGINDYTDAVPFYFCDAGVPGTSTKREFIIAAGGNGQDGIVFDARSDDLNSLNYYSHVHSGIYDRSAGKVDYAASPGSPTSSCNNIRISDLGTMNMYFTNRALDLLINRIARHFTDCHKSCNCIFELGNNFVLMAKNYNYETTNSSTGMTSFVDNDQPGYGERPIP